MQNFYIGKTCPYCQFPVKQDSGVALCPTCKVPHHRTCWEENRGCTTYGCKETTFKTPAQSRSDSHSGASANGLTAPAGSGFNTFLAIALVVSVFVIVALIVKLSDNQQIAPQSTEQVADQTNLQADEVIYFVITEQGSNLFIRRSPGRNNKSDSDIITKVPRGTQFTVINNHGNSVKKDGFTWWEIRVIQSGVTGWVAAEYISTNSSDVKK